MRLNLTRNRRCFVCYGKNFILGRLKRQGGGEGGGSAGVSRAGAGGPTHFPDMSSRPYTSGRMPRSGCGRSISFFRHLQPLAGADVGERL
jgi:hypothetical protein